jgi:hypothetical protein
VTALLCLILTIMSLIKDIVPNLQLITRLIFPRRRQSQMAECVHLLYTIDQGSPCPLATLNPFGRELLYSDVLAGIKRST